MRTFPGALFRARPKGNPLTNRLRQLVREASIRRGIRDLRELDDHLLRDIGLTPEDLPDAARYGRDFRLIRDLH
ncbi:DUF1127 domain-containing protein (plasmid) [Salipiger sp. H15]|uniref:DUF1127 domain-containing protein n=1 Tax=Alloyangia sp. H15 TaxID=3029062 RepID=A0AAU8ATS5_9RHOB